MDIRWSSVAADDLELICERIDRDNPEAARKVAQTIFGRASVRMSGRRELEFSPLPYIAVYKVTENAVEILRIFHGAQDWL